MRLTRELGNPNEIAAFVVTVNSNGADVTTSDPEIEIRDISPFFVYQIANIIAHETIHYDDYVNGAGEYAAKAQTYGKMIGKDKTYDDHGIVFTTKADWLNEAFGLNVQVKYDGNADQGLDRGLFVNPDRKMLMKREIAQKFDFDRDSELDSHILFEDEENLTDEQAELVKLARETLKRHPGADVKICKNGLRLYVY